LEKYHKLKVNALNAEKLDNQRKEVELQMNMKATNGKRQIEVNSTSVDFVKKQLELAQKVYSQTAQKFQQGIIGSSELIVAENGLQEAQTNLVSAYLKLRQSELEYLRTIGGIE
jgi:outer membrane protein TolC